MKIIFVMSSPMEWQSGIWYHRIEVPSRGLKSRGHGIRHIAIGKEFSQEMIEWADTVIFGRTYPQVFDPVRDMVNFKKAGKRVLLDLDDDFWQVSKDNPSVLVSNAFKDQYEGLIKECDAIITPSKILGKKIQKLTRKKVFLCHNSIDYDHYKERPREHKDLMIGYMGAASHWNDVSLVIEALEELYKKHDFYFVLYGLTGEPLESAMYHYQMGLSQNFQPEKNEYFKSALNFYSQLKKIKMLHVPFYPPELHPGVLSRADLDIGLAPLENTEFNRAKSNIKFYEYAAVGTVTLASDVEPYRSEVTYRAKNTTKDWYNKLEKLIVDVEFRKKLLKQQQDWVKEKRSITKVSLDWELACQRPGGLPVLNQQKK